MQYLISFLEGIITFISPCILPMLPVYVTYFAGGKTSGKSGKAFRNAIGFVIGFTMVFVAMGALAGTFGGFLTKYRTAVDAVTGLIVVLFGLNFLGVLKINLFRGMKGTKQTGEMGFFSSVLFGVIFSVGWTPCVGAFLGSALAMASGQGSTFEGIMMLSVFSLGLGIPFIVSAVLIDKLKGAFNFIKRNYKVINIICGCFLIVIGMLMMTGVFGKFVGFLS